MQPAAKPTQITCPAGFWIRLVAASIDLMLIATLAATLAGELDLHPYAPIPYSAIESDDFILVLLLRHWTPFILLFTALSAAYKTLLVGAWGGTIGKLGFGLRVVRFSDGGRVPYGRALARGLAQILSFVAFFLGYTWIALAPAKRGWHDYLCATRVVHRRPA
ncbi:MAG: RDD family protein [Nannocystis sp.]|nr:RDD family protein [Nannocystis sp.]